MARRQFSIRKASVFVGGCALLASLVKVSWDAVSMPRNAVTPTAIVETHYRIHLFAEQNGRLPKHLSELPKRDEYANRTVDLWGRELIYNIDVNGTITLGSYGRDGEVGGVGEDADMIHEYSSRDETGRLIAGDDSWVVDGEIYPEVGQ